MRKTIFKQFLMVVFGLTFLISCQQDDLQNVPDEKASDGLNSFLGKKLENPYSVTNMRKAFNSLKEKNQKNGLALRTDINADVVRPGFTDNVNGYTVEQIFGALRPGVETVQGFRNRLLQNNGNHQQQAVNDLFNAYFYN